MKNKPEPETPNLIRTVADLYVAIRCTEGREWIDIDTISYTHNATATKIQEWHKKLPGWHKENPVVRISRMFIQEEEQVILFGKRKT
jgi:hypothetical protein